MSRFDRLAVVGAGAWGTALANAAAAAGRRVLLWARDPAEVATMRAGRANPRRLPGIPLGERVTPTAALADLAAAPACLLVVPAQAARAVIARLAPVLPGATPLVICAKGIERGTGAFLSDVAAAERPDAPVATLSGPGFAGDVARGLPTAVTLASPDGGLARDLASALSGPTFRVYHATDLRGVEIGGAAKNVLAIGAGIVEGRGLGESAKAALIARGFAELVRFAVAAGARPETLMGLSGLGDVVLTCASPQSRNFALGLRLGRGSAPGAPGAAGDGPLAEGAFTAEALVARARSLGVEMPVAEAVTALLAGERSVDEAVAALMSRPLRAE